VGRKLRGRKRNKKGKEREKWRDKETERSKR
jgi:hypothetical protein